MIESFDTLKKGDNIYILDLKKFTFKESVVVEVDKNTIYTHYKDFNKEKLGGKVYFQSIKDENEYCTINKQELRNELVFLRDCNQSYLQDTGFQMNFYKKHHEADYVDSSVVSKLEEDYNRAKANLESINSTLEEL